MDQEIVHFIGTMARESILDNEKKIQGIPHVLYI
jgi:hypothetical protein